MKRIVGTLCLSILYVLGYSQNIHIDTILNFEDSHLPVLLQRFYPNNDIQIIYADELTIDQKTLYQYSTVNVSHHLIIIANKITFTSPLIVDLSGSLFHVNLAPFLFNIEADNNFKNLCLKYGDSLLNIHSQSAQKILQNYSPDPTSEYRTYIRFIDTYKTTLPLQAGNLVISAKQLIFDKDGSLDMISHGFGGGNFFIGFDTIILSSEKKLQLLETVRTQIATSFFDNLYNKIATENFNDQIQSSMPNELWYIRDTLEYKDLVKKGDKFDTALITKLLLRTLDCFDYELKMAYLINVNNKILPLSRFHDGNARYQFNAVMPSSDFMMHNIGGSPILHNGQINQGVDKVAVIYQMDNLNNLSLEDYYSDWVIHYLSYLKTQSIREKLLDNNEKELFKLVHKVSSLPNYRYKQEYNDKYTDLLKSLGDLKSSISLGMRVKPVSISNNFYNQTISLYSVESNKYLSEPTDIFLNSYETSENQYPILLDFNPEDPKEIFLNFSGELSVNSLLFESVKNKLAEDQELLDGIFTNCQLTFTDISSVGIIKNDTHINFNGKYISGRIACNAQLLDLILSIGLKNPGLILSVHWTYKNNMYEGDFNIPLNFTKSMLVKVNLVDNSSIKNLSKQPVIVHYLEKNGKVYLLPHPITIMPDSISLIGANQNISSTDSVSILNDGIETLFVDVQDFKNNGLKIISSNQVYDIVNITNNVSKKRTDGSLFQNLHLEIKYRPSSDTNNFITLKRDLNIKGFNGSQIEIPIIHLDQYEGIEITGRAYYDNGYADLKKINSRSSDISIDDSNFQ